MDEAEWLGESRFASEMLDYLRTRERVARTKRGRRKLRLFACGCCRVIWKQIHDTRLRSAVRTAERFADGEATKEELGAARRAASKVESAHHPDNPYAQVNFATAMAVNTTEPTPYLAALATASHLPLAGYEGEREVGESVLRHLLRCTFGNPFRPVSLDPAWLTPNVLALASTIYEEHAFDRLPILSDALLDAGCDNAEILAHCRSSGPHVRGCWVVDLLLGKR